LLCWLLGTAAAQVVCRLHRQPGNKKLIVYVFQIFTRTHLSSSLISGTWKTKDPDNDQEILQSFDMHYILGGLDGVDGTPFMDAMDRRGGPRILHSWQQLNSWHVGTGCCGHGIRGGWLASSPCFGSARPACSVPHPYAVVRARLC
jgi:hypothetical protein